MTRAAAQSRRVEPTIGTLAYEALVDAIGLGDPGEVLLGIGRAQSRISEVFAYWIAGDGPPVPIASAGSVGSASVRASLYSAEFHPKDPLTGLFSKVLEGGPTEAFRTSASAISDDRYRRECFVRPRLGDKLSFVQRRAGRTLVLNFYHDSADGRREEACLGQLAALALPLLRKHADLRPTRCGETDISRLSYQLARAYPALTAREREVCARSIIGMTAEATAVDLGIGTASVVTYRRRACRRFGLSNTLQFAAKLLL